MTRRRFGWLLVLALFVAGCGDSESTSSTAVVDDAPVAEDTVDEPEGDVAEEDVAEDDGGEEHDTDSYDDADSYDEPMPVSGDGIRNYIFGHSLIVHASSDETTVPHWLGLLARASDRSYAVDGQYGFLRGHADNDPQPQWGFAQAPGVWDVDSGMSFGDADFTHVMITPANFVQDIPASEPFADEGGGSPVSATLEIIDRAVDAEPGIEILIYENWPDLAAFSSYPPSADALAEYHTYTAGDFHGWWLDYVDELRSARPDVSITLVPVGSAIADLLSTGPWNEIAGDELYEDDAPHGRPTIYFLAALVTYEAMYGTSPPADFDVPGSVHPLVADDLASVIEVLSSHL